MLIRRRQQRHQSPQSVQNLEAQRCSTVGPQVSECETIRLGDNMVVILTCAVNGPPGVVLVATVYPWSPLPRSSNHMTNRLVLGLNTTCGRNSTPGRRFCNGSAIPRFSHDTKSTVLYAWIVWYNPYGSDPLFLSPHPGKYLQLLTGH